MFKSDEKPAAQSSAQAPATKPSERVRINAEIAKLRAEQNAMLAKDPQSRNSPVYAGLESRANKLAVEEAMLPR
jgi:hypothetical protein